MVFLRFPYLKTGVLFLITDAIIVTVSGFVFHDGESAVRHKNHTTVSVQKFCPCFNHLTKKEKKVIMCVMKKQISPKAEEIVRQEDPAAFMIVTSATEIFGEGVSSAICVTFSLALTNRSAR